MVGSKMRQNALLANQLAKDQQEEGKGEGRRVFGTECEVFFSSRITTKKPFSEIKKDHLVVVCFGNAPNVVKQVTGQKIQPLLQNG